MRFGPRHYVPVLKVKRAEKKALANIAPGLRRRVVPLLEIVERNTERTFHQHLSTSFKDLAASLDGYQRCFLDVREIEADGQNGATSVFTQALMSGIPFTPVTGISRTVDVDPAVALQYYRGLAVRLTRPEFEEGRLPNDLIRFLSTNGLTPDRVDLIVDLGSVYDLIAVGVMNLTQAFLADVPYKNQWRTLTITGTAFPPSMGVVNRNSYGRFARSEWLAWRDGLYRNRATLERLPTFSDCAIQHPAGVEGFNPVTMQVSATIRYASGNDWLLVKGESTRIILPSNQFPRLATRLAYDQLRGDFAGTRHCEGCQMVKASADGLTGFGSPEVWRKIGTIHHITSVVQDDLASLQWP